MLDLGRDTCNDRAAAEGREWLVTNGLGGYAMGTVAGILTRAYHGLLIAALSPPGAPGHPPAARTLLLVKLDETVTYQKASFPIHSNRYAPGTEGEDQPQVRPAGFLHLDRFHLEGTIPVWTYGMADALLEKRVWMEPGANTTYIQYTVRRASEPLFLSIQALVNYRDHHGHTAAEATWPMAVDPVPDGLRIGGRPGAPCFYLLGRDVRFTALHGWRPGFLLSVEAYRGLVDQEAHLHAADLQAELHPGQSLTIVASTEALADLDGGSAYGRRQAHEQALIAQAPTPNQRAIRHLVLTADQFIVRRPLPDGAPGRSVIAGYPWFGDWGRDTMIALPGLTLVTGRPQLARLILETFAHYVHQGMLPNRFPDAGEVPEYNTVDATLWYVEAIRAYHEATGDNDLLDRLYPTLQSIVDWHGRGTRYGIQVDTNDGLLQAGEPGVQLTWMDAKVNEWVVTPRRGKPVEINALWYNALRVLANLARHVGQPDASIYDEMAEETRAGFARFWRPQLGYCLDVLDGPNGDDPSLRPNQLFAVALPHSPLSGQQQRAVVEVCARHLLTPHGLRSLAPDDPAYIGRYGGDRKTRDAAYHQGTTWGWLIGPFVSAHLRVYQDPGLARSFLLPLLRHLDGHCVGSLSEIFDGDPPYTPRGCIAQAWTVAEVLRAWWETENG